MLDSKKDNFSILPLFIEDLKILYTFINRPTLPNVKYTLLRTM